ncbi:tyrosinase family protein [Ralstonia solanacearum]|uniref:tyrosinase family protein n=1 Tax=Ralstonia solanacearum TaxID=305 RepID=UPI0009C08CBB|nr:tyrosinase family protein [Ralstonia solanacearum]
MPYVRRDVYSLPAGDKTLEWYGKAIEKLQSRPITDVTSWLSLGAIHGIDPDIWTAFQLIQPGETMPDQDIQDTLWNQCQHMTWYFLPWHRGYLAAFEQIVRQAVVELGGPSDWALPYWNYSRGGDTPTLPPAFSRPTLDNGDKNFLYVQRRYGNGDIQHPQNPIVLDPRVVAIAATLQEPLFEGVTHGGSAGFGGVQTEFWHGDNSVFGVLEASPHNHVHVAAGGGASSNDPLAWGLMTNPDTAALDPIFWLHHANIDRLWSVWLRQTPQPGDPAGAFENPTSKDWLDGPADRQFALPSPNGTLYNFTPRDMLDTRAPNLDYVYDDESVAPAAVSGLALRLRTLGVPAEQAIQLAGDVIVAAPQPPTLLGANSTVVQLDKPVVETRVRLDTNEHRLLVNTLSMAKLAAGVVKAPDRVYLNLENIKSTTDAALYYVYVNLPEGANPEQSPEHFAGTVSMFGVSGASDKAGSTAGNGVGASFDITHIIDKLHAADALGGELTVKLVSATGGDGDAEVSIGRISVYRQGR